MDYGIDRIQDIDIPKINKQNHPINTIRNQKSPQQIQREVSQDIPQSIVEKEVRLSEEIINSESKSKIELSNITQKYSTNKGKKEMGNIIRKLNTSHQQNIVKIIKECKLFSYY